MSQNFSMQYNDGVLLFGRETASARRHVPKASFTPVVQHPVEPPAPEGETDEEKEARLKAEQKAADDQAEADRLAAEKKQREADEAEAQEREKKEREADEAEAQEREKKEREAEEARQAEEAKKNEGAAETTETPAPTTKTAKKLTPAK